MEEDEIDSIIDKFLGDLERDVVYLKVVKKRHVHWWDGWKNEEDSPEEKEDYDEEEEDGRLIPFPSIEAAMTYTLNKKRWPCGMSYKLIVPTQKAEVTSLKNKEGSLNVSTVEFSSPVEGGEICKQGAGNEELVADEDKLDKDVFEACDAKIWAYEKEAASSSSVISLQSKKSNVRAMSSLIKKFENPLAKSHYLEKKCRRKPQDKEAIKQSFNKSNDRNNVISFESEMRNDDELSSSSGVEALEMVNCSPSYQDKTEAFGLPTYSSLDKERAKFCEKDSKGQGPDQGFSESHGDVDSCKASHGDQGFLRDCHHTFNHATLYIGSILRQPTGSTNLTPSASPNSQHTLPITNKKVASEMTSFGKGYVSVLQEENLENKDSDDLLLQIVTVEAEWNALTAIFSMKGGVQEGEGAKDVVTFATEGSIRCISREERQKAQFISKFAVKNYSVDASGVHNTSLPIESPQCHGKQDWEDACKIQPPQCCERRRLDGEGDNIVSSEDNSGPYASPEDSIVCDVQQRTDNVSPSTQNIQNELPLDSSPCDGRSLNSLEDHVNDSQYHTQPADNFAGSNSVESAVDYGLGGPFTGHHEGCTMNLLTAQEWTDAHGMGELIKSMVKGVFIEYVNAVRAEFVEKVRIYTTHHVAILQPWFLLESQLHMQTMYEEHLVIELNDVMERLKEMGAGKVFGKVKNVTSSFEDKEIYCAPVKIGGEDIFESDLIWRRLIRSVLEQSLAALKSSQGFIVL